MSTIRQDIHEKKRSSGKRFGIAYGAILVPRCARLRPKQIKLELNIFRNRSSLTAECTAAMTRLECDGRLLAFNDNRPFPYRLLYSDIRVGAIIYSPYIAYIWAWIFLPGTPSEVIQLKISFQQAVSLFRSPHEFRVHIQHDEFISRTSISGERSRLSFPKDAAYMHKPTYVTNFRTMFVI